MIKRIHSTALVVALLGLMATSCGSDPDLTPYCGGEGVICQPSGFPFMTGAGSRSDACPGGAPCAKPLSQTTGVLSQPEPGKLCMKGTVAASGFSELILFVSQWDKTGTWIVDVFDAKKRGITGLTLNIEQPPSAGISMFVSSASKRHCATPPECVGEEWNLMTGPRSNLVKVIDTPGPVSAPFSNFARLSDPNQVLDASALVFFILPINPGAYDFCISNVKFVDAQGLEVVAPPLSMRERPRGEVS